MTRRDTLAGALRSHLARHIDFSLDGASDLGEMYYSLEPLGAVRNPSTSNAIIESALRVGRKSRGNLATCVAAIESHVLNDDVRTHLVTRDARVEVLLALLSDQPPRPEEATTIIAAGLSTRVANLLLADPTRFGLTELADLAPVLEVAAPIERLRWLSLSSPGELTETARAWIPAMFPPDTRITGERRFLATWAINAREDLFGDFVALGNPHLSTMLAGSRHLHEMAHQRSLGGLDDWPDNPSAAELRDWVKEWRYSVLALVNNPRCSREVIDEIRERLATVAEKPALRWVLEADGDSLLDGMDSRLARYNRGRSTITEPFEEVSDPLLLDWLVSRCAPAEAGRARHHDALALVKNPHLSETQRASVEATAYRPEEPDGNVVWDRALTMALRRELRCSSSCGGDHTQCAQASGCQRYGHLDYAELSMGEVERHLGFLGEAHHTWAQSTPLSEWIVERLGLSPEAHQTLLSLVDGWDDTLGALIETVIALTGVEAN